MLTGLFALRAVLFYIPLRFVRLFN
jgi:hypothetical protein